MVAKHCFLLWIFNPFLLFYADFSHRNNQFIHLRSIEGLQFQEIISNLVQTGISRITWSFSGGLTKKAKHMHLSFHNSSSRLNFVDSIAVKTVIILRRRVRN